MEIAMSDVDMDAVPVQMEIGVRHCASLVRVLVGM
jgi:hypothetical protein